MLEFVESYFESSFFDAGFIYFLELYFSLSTKNMDAISFPKNSLISLIYFSISPFFSDIFMYLNASCIFSFITLKASNYVLYL